jgi:hypothetical protein
LQAGRRAAAAGAASISSSSSDDDGGGDDDGGSSSTSSSSGYSEDDSGACLEKPSERVLAIARILAGRDKEGAAALPGPRLAAEAAALGFAVHLVGDGGAGYEWPHTDAGFNTLFYSIAPPPAGWVARAAAAAPSSWHVQRRTGQPCINAACTACVTLVPLAVLACLWPASCVALPPLHTHTHTHTCTHMLTHTAA